MGASSKGIVDCASRLQTCSCKSKDEELTYVLNSRAPSSMLDGGLNVFFWTGALCLSAGRGDWDLLVYHVTIAAPYPGGRGLKCCSFTFELMAIKKKLCLRVTSSNWNSLLSCNSINTPSRLTMGSQGFSLWLASQGKMAVQGSQMFKKTVRPFFCFFLCCGRYRSEARS